MALMRDILGVLGIVIIALIGHVATGDNGMDDIKGMVSGMVKAINDLIRWIERQ